MKHLLFSALLMAAFAGLSAQSADPVVKPVNYLLEEEKLARDVYLTFKDQYKLQVFSNISTSEQQHLDWMIDLAKQKGLTIPPAVIKDQRGDFTDPSLVVLYKKLTDQGKNSLADALKAGALIEETDIADLDNAMTNATGEELNLYRRLRMSSENHLRAFVKNLNAQGVEYQPTVLAAADYDLIVSGDNQGGGGACCSGMQGNNQGKGKGKKAGKNGSGGGCCKSK